MKSLAQIIKKNEILYDFILKIYSLIQENHKLCIFYNKIRNLFREKKLEKYRNYSLKRYCVENHINIQILEPIQIREVYKPKYHDFQENAQILKFESPEIYRTKLVDVSIVGGSSFVIKDDYMLYDMFELDIEHRFDLRFGNLVSINDEGESAINVSSSDGERIENGIFLAGFGSFNYYHLTIELMTKFKYIDTSDEFVRYPLLVDKIVADIPQYKSLIDILNTTNRKIIFLESGKKYEVKNLLFISDISWMPINVKGSLGLVDKDCRMSKECIKYLRDKVIESYKIESSPKTQKKIFLSRKSNFLQRLSNEVEIAEMFSRYGYKIVYPEELSLKEQVELFSQASIVVGTTGAALTNIIYCLPGTKFISIIPKEYNFNIYSTIAYNLGLEIVYLDSKVIKRGKKISGDRFKLDLEYCESFLKDSSI